MFNQLVTYADPSGTNIANCTLQCMVDSQKTWIATFSENYSAVPATAFAGHGMSQGDLVVLKCSDVTHVWFMAANGSADTVY
jgi:hypothetical protein